MTSTYVRFLLHKDLHGYIIIPERQFASGVISKDVCSGGTDIGTFGDAATFADRSDGNGKYVRGDNPFSSSKYQTNDHTLEE